MAGSHVSSHQETERKNQIKEGRKKANHEEIDQSRLIENVTFLGCLHHKMNISCLWELIEMLYIDVEQQPVGNVCEL